MPENKSSFSVGWKDLIYIITLVVGLTTSYVTNKVKVNQLGEKVQETKDDVITIEEKLDESNLELILYQINEIQKKTR